MKTKETVDYQLRGIPADLWNQARHRAVDEKISIKELILRALRMYLGQKGNKK